VLKKMQTSNSFHQP